MSKKYPIDTIGIMRNSKSFRMRNKYFWVSNKNIICLNNCKTQFAFHNLLL